MEAARSPLASEWTDDVVAGIFAYYLTAIPIVVGIAIGNRSTYDPIDACIRHDATHQIDIIRNGYAYEPDRRSTVAFFPAYPLLSRGISMAADACPYKSAFVVSNVSLIAAFVFFLRWMRLRWPSSTARDRLFTLAIFGLWPMGVFFRMPYAEGTFLAVVLIFLYGMARHWPSVVLALIAGLATAIRPVGLAVAIAFYWRLLCRPGSRPKSPLATLALMTLAAWGIVAFVAFQWLAFGSPLAFVQTQQHWSLGAPTAYGWTDKALSLFTFEPIRGIYDPHSLRYWRAIQPGDSSWFSIMFWNPLFFVVACVSVAIGAWKGWLDSSEAILGASLLAIPYVTRAYEMSMGSHGRFPRSPSWPISCSAGFWPTSPFPSNSRSARR